MPIFERGAVSIYYEDSAQRRGARDAFPLLLLAPGGMRSAIPFWDKAAWQPLRELADSFRVIAMDQRNAGRSRAPVSGSDGWPTYCADQLALLDHLGIERCHLLGGCIGGSFALALIQSAPERIAAAVLQQPIGLHGENRSAFYELFDSWATELAPRLDPAPSPADWAAFRSRMYDGEFVFSVSRESVRRCAHPLLVLMGNDVYHPEPISCEIAALAPHAELIERWKTPDAVGDAVKRVRAFLEQHRPAR